MNIDVVWPNVLFLILGWLLALLSPGITDYFHKKREIKSLRVAILTELREMQLKLLMMVFRIRSKYSILDREFFDWAKSILEKYDGINSGESLLRTMEPLLKIDKKELSELLQYYAQQNSRPESGLSLKKFSLAFLEANIAALAMFDKDLLGYLLEIKMRIGFMNEMVDESRYYFQLSFQSGITHENYINANVNMVGTYKSYADQAHDVADIIHKLRNL
ncbi:MAG: hypothetical protein UX18_C0009G0011 [Candidatus Azambacteria bacterium GW2011_GWC2_45_7b]|nr:MAG: hypothetical protein UW15_C0008G0006 [Parcubacteria group bacterium GW2011_GWC1_44_10]KKT60292.1 MAG: hypothetical protein UW53_C0002G0044 [Candidatus Giovannonibacteria bacterium GW2011_GWA1_44_25]KKU12836.1 MAG: hypothetical protein UX18_C0009G0011 [Candidatus Azambacteria bacterium GW2011_GWC2_45_7b]KKU29680.1 MAG: hypothetical protein UX43_C0007G0022 [Candidatus Giovannonibacteria bacterium GW2011_GWB1_46_20]